MRANVRLIVAILSSLAEQAALVVLVLWGLPRLGIDIPVPALIALMAVLAAYDVISYRLGSRALRRKPVAGLTDMVGSKGLAVGPLDPEGMVKIKGELWQSRSVDRKIDAGEEVVVVGQQGLKLVVRGQGKGGGSR